MSGANGVKHIWKKYTEKLLNAENDLDGDVDCLISEVASAIPLTLFGYWTFNKHYY